MKTTNHLPVLLLTMLVGLTMVSWNHLTATNTSYADAGDEAYYKMLQVQNTDMPWANDIVNNAMIADDDYNYAPEPDNAPAAEDVMVQKIPGDNSHLLMMAIYSYKTFHEASFILTHEGKQLLFRDDGQDYDKVAGDGVYTTRVDADVNEFRRDAISLDAQARQIKHPITFVGRELKDPRLCTYTPFDAKKLDNYEAVSISGVNGGSNDLIDSVRNNCIFITDLKVVEDPTRTWNPCTQTGNVDGPWTFKTLIKNMVKKNPTDNPSDSAISAFVTAWLNNWKVKKVILGDTAPARTLITKKVITPWQNKSKAAGAPAGQLDMRFAPFKLTSIVNRFDIRERAAGIPAGEGRFTFCLIDSSCTRPLEMTIVIEYAIPKPDVCDSLQAWATQWFNLKDLNLGSPEYNAALQKITEQYSVFGTSKNGQLGLDALRTNEREFAPTGVGVVRRWEFREFGLTINTKSTIANKLVMRKVAQIPQDKFNAQVDNPDVRAMVAWINANKDSINADSYIVPDTLPGNIKFLGGHAQILDTPVGIPTQPYHWDGVETQGPARITNTTTRHIFSRNTCTGCHAGEVQTFFTHVDPVFFGTQSTLSGFLTGTAGRGGAVDWDNNPGNDSFMVKDAANRGSAGNSTRMFNDILRRAKDLKDFVLTPPCKTVFAIRNELMFKPLGAVH